MEDYYSILGVSQSANISTIRESYRKLALRFHPDKNKNKSATSDFQRIVRAWEVLRDQEKRATYDKEFFGTSDWNREQHFDDSPRTEERREEDGADENNRAIFARIMLHLERLIRRKESRIWKNVVQEKYLSRFNAWKDIKRRLIPLASANWDSIRLRESQFNFLSNMNNSETIIQFRAAIELSSLTGTVCEDPTVIVSKLISAKERFLARLSQELSDVKNQYDQTLLQLAENQRIFELWELNAQQLHIQEALQILGPRQMEYSLPTDVDLRLQAINRWESLAKISSAKNVSHPSWDLDEGPWHSDASDWERLAGEHQCSRCNKTDFHVIPECAPAKCLGCGVVVCNECYRDLWLLRRYEEWILSSDEEGGHCFFTLEV
jgi:hypothetical protein